MSTFSRHLLTVLLSCILLWQSGGLAQTPNPYADKADKSPAKPVQPVQSPTPEAASTPNLKDIKAKLTAVQNELTGLLAATESATASGTSVILSEQAMDTRELLSQMIRAYTRQIGALGSLESEQQRGVDLEHEAAVWKGFPNPPPYSIRTVDELRESLQSVQQYAQTVKSTAALVNNTMADLQTSLAQSESTLRQLNEKLEATDMKPGTGEQLAAKRDLVQLRIRSNQATLEMLRLEQQLFMAKDLNLNRQCELLRRQISVAEKNEEFTQADLDKINASVAAELRKLEKELQRVIADTPSAQKALAEARQNFHNAQQAPASPDVAPAEQSAKLAQLQEIVEVRRIQLETIGICEEQIHQLQQLQNLEQGAWQLRLFIFNSDPLKAREAIDKITLTLNRLRLTREYYQEQADLNSRQLTDLEDYLRNNTSAPQASLKIAQDKLDSFRTRDAYYKRVLRSLEKLERQGQRWKEQINQQVEVSINPQKRVARWYAGFGDVVSAAWNYEFYKVVDPQFPGGLRPITVQKIITAFGILLVGYLFCRLLSFQMQIFLTARLRMESNMAQIIRGWVMFFLSLGLVMIAMDWVKIPLTAFAFLGGALAIGIGFGTQNLLKNFISGIMLLVEQPLRLGDLVEVGSSRGRVVNIGIRSSVIRNADGIETLIPNSAFLETNVTNWTYSNPQVRFKIRVGVMAGSSSREAADLLAETVDSHGLVFKNPKPQVLLEEFTEKGMVFGIYYWLEPLKCDASGISSDLRFMIERRLTEAGIQMC